MLTATEEFNKCKCILSHPSGGFFAVAKRKEKTYVCKVRQAP